MIVGPLAHDDGYTRAIVLDHHRLGWSVEARLFVERGQQQACTKFSRKRQVIVAKNGAAAIYAEFIPQPSTG
ncbi:hypothetical protein EN820_48515 [bacterium M00.F.Ca.ET.177.01.1.1]|nr:hypothetical protein EN820_48515 [bacterium M00.F.Ca.ET.177.01.1.1]TGT10725.1 hypothetical protein EN856_35280 [Mesorhizobium sp. M8A.F.Ca.ET.213.01.1.1]